MAGAWLADMKKLDLGGFTLRGDLGARDALAVICVAGTYVCVDESTSGDFGGMHPFAAEQFEVFDVTGPTDPNHRLSLLSVFREADVVSALRRDAFITSHVADVRAFRSASTVAQLFAALDPRGDCVGFDADAAMHGFAFHHLEDGKVAVRIALPYGSEICRGHFTQLGLLLPIPSSLGAPLAHAADRSAGFLQEDAKQAGAAKLDVEFKPDASQFHKH
jgi:hypothetical protein